MVVTDFSSIEPEVTHRISREEVDGEKQDKKCLHEGTLAEKNQIARLAIRRGSREDAGIAPDSQMT
jgi:hypothetical protein